jgi:hypothetical protein
VARSRDRTDEHRAPGEGFAIIDSWFADDLLRELGLVAAMGSLVEATALGIVSDLAVGDQPDADSDTVAALIYGQPISWLLERVVLLAPRRNEEVAGWLTTWAHRARAAMEKLMALIEIPQ